jgi:methyl-accepting chemotaxis protein
MHKLIKSVIKKISSLSKKNILTYLTIFIVICLAFQYKIIGFIVLVGYIVSCYTKNIKYILGIPTFFTLLIFIFNKRMLENMTSEDTTSSSPTTPISEEDKKKRELPVIDDDFINNMTHNISDKITSMKNEADLNNNSSEGDDMDITGSSDNIEEPDAMVSETMTSMYSKNNRIDYATTVENAYGDLDRILGGDGIKKLTDDTQRLMKQQVALTDAMKNMTPLIGQAKELLQGFDLKNLDGLASMAKSLI